MINRHSLVLVVELISVIGLMRVVTLTIPINRPISLHILHASIKHLLLDGFAFNSNDAMRLDL